MLPGLSHSCFGRFSGVAPKCFVCFTGRFGQEVPGTTPQEVRLFDMAQPQSKFPTSIIASQSMRNSDGIESVHKQWPEKPMPGRPGRDGPD
ncbi:hypothetical protein BQ8794_130308 [Mesorhizobium prunaredense]|uniref:Uncharacterized protein n=1 Tax=Mesorhizobium prunaredense TaxID=1631249 RepID=A0A1R3V608_9HYPH|nr:hypothetical protein BQ8794_130308 [Mesorhizobium prunaredense]